MKKLIVLCTLMLSFGVFAQGQNETTENTTETKTAKKVTADKKYVTAKMNTKVVTNKEAEIKKEGKKSDCGSKKSGKSCCSSKKAKKEKAETSVEKASLGDESKEDGNELAKGKKKQ